ncbi:unnamed protein product, partial [marine sediment metagenome]
VFQVSDVKRYPLGKYLRIGNKGFVYAKAGGALIPDMGAKQSHNQKFVRSNIAAAVPAGATTITVTIDFAGHPERVDSPIILNELAGGQLLVFPAGNQAFIRTIVSNSALVAGGILTIVLDAPVPCAVGLVWCGAIINPYDGVDQVSNEWTPVMGMPMIPATAGQYLWLQVEGISWCSPEAAVGAAVNCLEVCFGGDGALKLRNVAIPAEQRAGMVIAPNPDGDGVGSPFIMLNIDH